MFEYRYPDAFFSSLRSCRGRNSTANVLEPLGAGRRARSAIATLQRAVLLTVDQREHVRDAGCGIGNGVEHSAHNVPRVMATVRFISWGVIPFGALAAGAIASAAGNRTAMWGSGAQVRSRVERRRLSSSNTRSRSRPTTA
jgi:hypothetical protein